MGRRRLDHRMQEWQSNKLSTVGLNPNPSRLFKTLNLFENLNKRDPHKTDLVYKYLVKRYKNKIKI